MTHRTKTKSKFALFLLLGCFAGSAQLSAAERMVSLFEEVQAHFDRMVPELMEKYQVPAVAIAIVDANGPIYQAGFGYSDASRSRAVDETTLFEGASLGKPLFAHTVLHHASAASFDVQSPVADYLARPFMAEPEGMKISSSQLLSHSSGLAYSESAGRRYLVFSPGSQWQYSGLGFIVLQQVVEELWRGSLHELVSQTVTGPLGMESTSYLPPKNDALLLAEGHDRQGQRLQPTAWPSANAASSLHTSARDYGRFLSLVLREYISGENSRVAQMMDVQVEVDRARHLWWGLGWAISQEESQPMFLHWGSNPGYKSLAVGSLQQGIAMVVLTNGDNGLDIARSLVPIVFGKDYAFLGFYMLHPDD